MPETTIEIPPSVIVGLATSNPLFAGASTNDLLAYQIILLSRLYAAHVDMVEDIDSPAVIARICARLAIQTGRAVPADAAGIEEAFVSASEEADACGAYAAAVQANEAATKAQSIQAAANTVLADAAQAAARAAAEQADIMGLLAGDAAPAAFHALFTDNMDHEAAVAAGVAAAYAAKEARESAAVAAQSETPVETPDEE